ncbi:hypothetical protein [Riemerella anatipestifer]|uniref:Uncharacterized protein n=1 Tax=Riemerella anatipestifer TaxID=34085 RepID=A0AAP6LK07_RIEAN|nr:hypothetical protein [Riemerella anatipestifer]MCO7354026.1 hypothetical protein [Riemerella anatipestifer]MCU7559144.1 hypothetical protein [Riemerella anatipestifer]MCU7571126.1 hypothetical protein [Riemerella anatipestifer]MCU7597597.1 hypothetical protein [Riemerella anatipestifer]MCW0488340.1 hypothetical protein [Riemerella anatipestifer]
MGKFVLVVLIIYILYYTGNIIYDLYIKKEKVEEVEEEVVTIEGIDTEENVANVEIDDIEEMATPKGFTNEEEYNIREGEQENEFDEGEKERNILELEKKHKEESQLDSITKGQEVAEKKVEEQPKLKTDFKRTPTPEEFRKIINDAESNVYIASEKEGHICYNMK